LAGGKLPGHGRPDGVRLNVRPYCPNQGGPNYLIHLYDTPALAERGPDAAKRYSQIAPAAPHAQHMPSHIFTRVGYSKDSISSNMASVKAALASREASDQLHVAADGGRFKARDPSDKVKRSLC
jgi:hypothetical protein